MTTIYGIKNCDTMKKAFTWLDEHEVEYEFRSVKENPLSEEELERFVHYMGIETLLNKRGMTWRKLGLAKKEDLTEDDLFEALLDNQTMIKRPLVEMGESVMVGFDEEAFEHFFADEDE
jgi:Spx/MgsR family transcriptional regulator